MSQQKRFSNLHYLSKTSHSLRGFTFYQLNFILTLHVILSKNETLVKDTPTCNSITSHEISSFIISLALNKL